MRVVHKLTVHMDDRRCVPYLDMMQLDADTRVLELTLLCGGEAWEVPSGKTVSVAFRKSDGHGGWYDTLPDGSAACSYSGNVVTAVLAPEVLTAAGKAKVVVVIQDASTLDQIAAFPVTVDVTPNPAAGRGISNDYYEHKTMDEVNAAVEGSLQPAKYGVSASSAESAGWTTIRDLPVNRIYRFPYSGRPENFGLPYEEDAQCTLVVIGTGNTSWCTMYICAVRNGGTYIAYDDPAATGDVQWRPLGDADPTDVAAYLKGLAASGQSVARFYGEHTVTEKIAIPAGMTIIGGTFTADAAYEGALFSAQGDNVRLVGVTMKAPALDKVASIYTDNGLETTAKDSNVLGLYSDGHEGIALIDCVTDKIIPAKINNGSGMIQGCWITDCSMFVWGRDCRMAVSDNAVSICNTGLDRYYHVYYLDRNSELVASNNRIRCDTDVAYRDIYHLMTAGNGGVYRASGIVDGDVVTGNFQCHVDCHYVDLALKNCTIANTNTGEWVEIDNRGHVTYRFEGCTLDHRGAGVSAYDEYDPNRDAEITYDRCRLLATAPLHVQRVYRDCVIEMDLTGVSLLTNHFDAFHCHFRVSGTPTGIAISDEALDGRFVGNEVIFSAPPTSGHLFRGAEISGGVINNCIYGANGATLWAEDRGRSHNNYIDGEVAT